MFNFSLKQLNFTVVNCLLFNNIYVDKYDTCHRN